MSIGGRAQKYLAEVMGNFYLVATIALVTSSNNKVDSSLVPLAIGAVLMAVIFAMGHVSSAHYNPAITLINALRRDVGIIDAAFYVVAQLIGSVAGGLAAAFIVAGEIGAPIPKDKNDPVGLARAGVAEIVYTSCLALVILHVAASKQKGNSFYGSSIAASVVAGICAVGGVSGAVFNPAVGTGLTLARCATKSCDALPFLWLYWIAPCGGALLGSLLFTTMTVGDVIPTENAGSCSSPPCTGDDDDTVCLRPVYSGEEREPTGDGTTNPCLRARVCRTASETA